MKWKRKDQAVTQDFSSSCSHDWLSPKRRWARNRAVEIKPKSNGSATMNIMERMLTSKCISSTFNQNYLTNNEGKMNNIWELRWWKQKHEEWKHFSSKQWHTKNHGHGSATLLSIGISTFVLWFWKYWKCTHKRGSCIGNFHRTPSIGGARVHCSWCIRECDSLLKMLYLTPSSCDTSFTLFAWSFYDMFLCLPV